jgi:hypothetical protein
MFDDKQLNEEYYRVRGVNENVVEVNWNFIVAIGPIEQRDCTGKGCGLVPKEPINFENWRHFGLNREQIKVMRSHQISTQARHDHRAPQIQMRQVDAVDVHVAKHDVGHD